MSVIILDDSRMFLMSSALHKCIRSCARMQLASGSTHLFSAYVQLASGKANLFRSRATCELPDKFVERL